ncbi:hypothetical protein GCM10023187_22770 [Nibrella viscosa]|uniref:DUF2147 domain-containing protein n=1 Tax=Nibrella viscosa TaxID=1084524 RepID=A0ABP8KEU1_9BACT
MKKKHVLLVTLLALLSVNGYSVSQPADAIVGRWFFPARQSSIELYRSGDRYFGRITEVGGNWKGKFNGTKDQLVLTNLTFNGREWSGGELIHPQTGSRYDVALSMQNPQNVLVTVYKGVRLLHKEYELVREK